ncbi:MAG TPA: hypothetical protein VF816_15710 [Rhodocyclaceae bacterium]
MREREAGFEGPGDPAAQEGKPFFARTGLYVPLIFVGGIAVAVLLFVRGMHWLGLAPAPVEGVPAVVSAPAQPDAVLYASPSTRAFLKSVQGDQEPVLVAWRRFFAESRRPYREIDDPGLLRQFAASVVVVPYAVALSAQEVEALAEHQRQGGAILATGPFGARDGDGNWTDWQALQRLFGAKVVGEADAKSPLRWLVTEGEAPVVQNLPAGTPMELGALPDPVLLFDGGQQAAYLSDDKRSSTGKGGAILYGDVGEARWAIFGFSENAWAAQPTLINQLVAGALDWLQHKAMATVSAAGPVSATLSDPGGQLKLELSNGGTRSAAASVVVLLPRRGSLTLEATNIMMPAGSVTAVDPYRARIAFDTLPPGNFAYHLKVE